MVRDKSRRVEDWMAGGQFDNSDGKLQALVADGMEWQDSVDEC